MKKKIAVLPGDGIGPGVIAQAIKVMDAVNGRFGHEFELDHQLIGAISIRQTGEPLSDEVIDICRSADAVLLGAIGDPAFDNNPDATVRPEQGLLKLRKALGLHSNIRPLTVHPNLIHHSPLKPNRLHGVDLVIYRELTGGIYFGSKETSIDGKVSADSCTYSTLEIRRIAIAAFEAARARNKKLTLVDKANVLETSRLWRKCIRELAKDYPDVEVLYMFVDNAAMQLVLNPAQFDVILTENMFGDILSDLASVLGGSIGLLPSSSIGDEHALFEPIHGSYPQAEGLDIANPIATILSTAMMYEYFGLDTEANCIRNAVDWAIENNFITVDLNKKEGISCSKCGDMIALHIEEKGEFNLNLDAIEEARNSMI